jgi:hypothetical protein
VPVKLSSRSDMMREVPRSGSPEAGRPEQMNHRGGRKIMIGRQVRREREREREREEVSIRCRVGC